MLGGLGVGIAGRLECWEVEVLGGGCFTNSNGLSDRGRTILLWTNSMGQWSDARTDSPSLLVKQPLGALVLQNT